MIILPNPCQVIKKTSLWVSGALYHQKGKWQALYALQGLPDILEHNWRPQRALLPVALQGLCPAGPATARWWASAQLQRRLSEVGWAVAMLQPSSYWWLLWLASVAAEEPGARMVQPGRLDCDVAAGFWKCVCVWGGVRCTCCSSHTSFIFLRQLCLVGWSQHLAHRLLPVITELLWKSG